MALNKRRFKYSAQSYQYLRHNAAHQFAAGHALRIYRSRSIYSFIPKNACTTLRVSLALANGCIAGSDDFNWIHANNDTFRAELADLATARYTFAILRCPYARLASVFLDKIVGKTDVAWHLHDLTKRRLEPEAMTFGKFVKAVTRAGRLRANIHWRPQSDFLVYEEYDDYFSLERFAAAQRVIEAKAGLEIVDARPLTKHGIDGLELVEGGNPDRLPPTRIALMKQRGQCPSPASLYTDETIALVAKHFQRDIELYRELFGGQDLMFS